MNTLINYCTLSDDGHKLTLPPKWQFSLDKDEYRDFKQSLLNVKAVWVGNQQFEFPYNAKNVIERMAAGDNIDFRKLQLFPTPIDLADYMWECLIYELGFTFAPNIKVLEPGAGTGNLIKYLANKGIESIDYCEICPEFDYIIKAETEGIKTKKVGDDFLKSGIKEQYDLVFANPPFSSDTKHFSKMLESVKEGGYVCTLMGDGFFEKNQSDDFEAFSKKYGFKEWFCTGTPRFDAKEKDEWIFENTPSGYSLLVVRKFYERQPISKREKIKQQQTALFE